MVEEEGLCLRQETVDGRKGKKNSEESGVVGKQINSSVGWSRVFSGVTPNICFARRRPRCLVPARYGIYTGQRRQKNL